MRICRVALISLVLLLRICAMAYLALHGSGIVQAQWIQQNDFMGPGGW